MGRAAIKHMDRAAELCGALALALGGAVSAWIATPMLVEARQPVALVRAFVAAGKPVGAICHGPWLLVEADVVRGRRVTGWRSILTDLRNAGGIVVDEAAVTDGMIVTSRSPEDVAAFIAAMIDLVEAA